jgi:hypothetical protein
MPTTPRPFEDAVRSGEVECSPRSYAWATATGPSMLESWEFWDGEPLTRASMFCLGGEALKQFVAVSAEMDERPLPEVRVGGIPEDILDLVLNMLEETEVVQGVPSPSFWDMLPRALADADAAEYVHDVTDMLRRPAFVEELMRQLGVNPPAVDAVCEDSESGARGSHEWVSTPPPRAGEGQLEDLHDSNVSGEMVMESPHAGATQAGRPSKPGCSTDLQRVAPPYPTYPTLPHLTLPVPAKSCPTPPYPTYPTYPTLPYLTLPVLAKSRPAPPYPTYPTLPYLTLPPALVHARSPRDPRAQVDASGAGRAARGERGRVG